MNILRHIILSSLLLAGAASFAQQEYTRGIGLYPGRPSQSAAPRLVPAGNELRNLSRNRVTFASSQFDNNLTAQLATDGIVSPAEGPCYLRVTTPAGLVPRREMEWSLDVNPYTHNVMPGSDTYIHYQMVGFSATPDRLCLEGQVAYDEGKFSETDTYTIALEGSQDGRKWTVLTQRQGKGLPGRKSWSQLHSDPDKRLGQGPLPTRDIVDTLTIAKPKAYSHLRLHVSMPSASHWSVSQANLFQHGRMIDLKPSHTFVSCWMSQELSQPRQTEWLSVDLGARADIERVSLRWVEKAVSGSIQVSDDGAEWSTVAPLPGGKSLKEEIPCRASGRYVRLLMEEAAGRRYTLSEMEVTGRGGVVPVAMDQPEARRDTLMLSGGDWQVCRAVAGKALPVEGELPGALPATVPGTVLVSYINAGAVANTNYADYGTQPSESYFRSNFWYRDTFTLPRGFARDHVYLNFDGINWKANVWLNGRLLGHSDGAFIRSRYEVTDLLREGGNELFVEVICNDSFGAAKEKNAMNTAINGGVLGADNPTFHASVGWDWINSTRGREVGIWNDVYLTTTGSVSLCDPFVETTLNLPDTTVARLRPQVVVANDGARDVKGRLVGRIGDVEFQRTVTIPAREQKTILFEPEEFPQLVMQNPRLWWPNGYGQPFLYASSFRFIPDGEGGETAIDFNTGIRQMTWHTAFEALTLYVNGRRFVGKGGNWGFPEHNLLYRGREYDAAVRYHREMNFTMIRNWVGQTGDDEFYDACDRYGIMVWQDFWLANPCDGPDPDDEQMFADNAEDMVMRIRRHPCLALYCGRNEGFPPPTLNKALTRIVKDVHPGLPYIGSSADDIVSGHGPYWAILPREYFELPTGRDKFHSERGMPNIMSYESLCRSLRPTELWPQGDAWGQHDFTLEGAQRGASFNDMLARMFGQPTSAEEFCNLAQWINYDGYRAMFESRSSHRRGLLLWMTHPCWPSMVWQTYDYYLEPTAAYFGSMHGCEPLHIQWNSSTDSVEVVNYSRPLSGERLTARALLYDMEGRLCWQDSASVDSPEDSTLPVLQLQFPLAAGDVQILRLVLEDARGSILSQNTYVKGREEGNLQALARVQKARVEMQVAPAKVSSDSELAYVVTLRNTSSVPAYMLRLNAKGEDGQQILPVVYEDNYLHLLPSEQRTIRVSVRKEDTRGGKVGLELTGYNVSL